MIRLPGILKVASVLLVEFLTVCALFNDPSIAGVVTGIVSLYVWLGGYLSLFKEGAVNCLTMNGLALKTQRASLLERSKISVLQISQT